MFDKSIILLYFIPKRKQSPAYYYKHEYTDEIFRRKGKENPQEKVLMGFILSTS